MTNRRRTYHGVSVGILMLETGFERFHGDVGNAATWPFPVQFHVVRGADPSRVLAATGAELLEPFKQAADELIVDGVDGITTSCGFLALYQRELAAHCTVPVATSALLQVPMVERLLPWNKRVGILTFSAEQLTVRHLEAVGVDPATPIIGLPVDSEFQRAIRTGDRTVSLETLRDEALAAARRLVASDASIGAIVCECTNLSPFSRDINRSLGVPVFDIVTMVRWFHGGLRPRRFVQD